MHQQMGVVGLQCFFVFFCFPGDHRRAQHQVSGHHRRLRVVKGQHVGGIVFLPVVAVQRQALVRIHDAHGDFGIAGQRVANPARHAVAWQGCAVQGRVVQIAKLQRNSQVFKSHFYSWPL